MTIIQTEPYIIIDLRAPVPPPMQILDEIWLPVAGFSNVFVSNTGKIRYKNAYSKLVDAKLTLDKRDNLLHVTVYNSHKRNDTSLWVAPTVYIAFVGQYKRSHKIAYRDGDPTNCRIDNLYLVHRSTFVKSFINKNGVPL